MSEYSDTLQFAPPRRTTGWEQAPAGGRGGALAAILGRIEEAIDLETTSIRSDPKFDLNASNARKSRHLYELNKAMKGISRGDLRPEDRAGILRLRDKLSTNEATIRAHLSAVTEVAALVQDAIERQEADGTYSSTAFGRAGGI
jgi:hypothetical protein